MSGERFARTLVIIPAFNEADNLAGVIGNIREVLPGADIAVMNDGSTDSTGAIASAAGVIVLNIPYNVGIGAAVQTGFKFAAAHDYAVVLRSDGDGQHTPQHFLQLIETLESSDADIVIGSRFIDQKGYGASLPRRAGIVILARLISLIIGQRVTDPTSGFSAFNRRTIKLCADIYPHDYPEPEAIVVLHRAGLHIREIPVTMAPRQGGQSSITPVRSAYYMVKVILAILIGLLRRAPVADNEL